MCFVKYWCLFWFVLILEIKIHQCWDMSFKASTLALVDIDLSQKRIINLVKYNLKYMLCFVIVCRHLFL